MNFDFMSIYTRHMLTSLILKAHGMQCPHAAHAECVEECSRQHEMLVHRSVGGEWTVIKWM